MRVLFVYPEVPDTFWNMKHVLKIISRKAALPPLGAVTVAAMLPAHWEKKLIDMTTDRLSDKDIRWADLVFISAMFIQKEAVKRVVARCKSLGVKVVGGGPVFTGFSHYFEDIDHLILNEAEVTLPMFLKDLERGEAKRIYESEAYADTKDTPMPLWELIDMKKYASMSIQYSRGCPFNCDFCNITTLFGQKIRVKTSSQVLDELDSLYLSGWRGKVFFVDDNFIGNQREVKKNLLPAIIEWMEERGHPFIFNTQVSINLADDEELMGLLARAGFETVFVGIETPDDQALADCRKYQNRNRDLLGSIKKIQGEGIQVQGGFILGFDSDRVATFETLIKFIQKSGIVTAMVGLLNAPRGTELYERLSTEDRLLKTAGSGDNTDYTMNFVPKMNHADLMRGYHDVVSTIYSPKYYYARILTLLEDYKPLKIKHSGMPVFCNIITLLKSMWFLGIMGRERYHYWKLLFWSLKRPEILQHAITFAIYGYHFRKIFKST